MSILQEFQQKKPEIFRDIMRYLMSATATPEEIAAMAEEIAAMAEEGTAQMIRGFLDVLEQGMQGDITARDEYLDLMVPPLKEGGLPLYMMGRAIAPMFGFVFARLGPEHARWLSQYAHDYSEQFFKIWEGVDPG